MTNQNPDAQANTLESEFDVCDSAFVNLVTLQPYEVTTDFTDNTDGMSTFNQGFKSNLYP